MFITPVFQIYEELADNQELLDAYEDLLPLVAEDVDNQDLQDYIEWPLGLSMDQIDELTGEQEELYNEITDIIQSKIEEFEIDAYDLSFVLIQNY